VCIYMRSEFLGGVDCYIKKQKTVCCAGGPYIFHEKDFFFRPFSANSGIIAKGNWRGGSVYVRAATCVSNHKELANDAWHYSLVCVYTLHDGCRYKYLEKKDQDLLGKKEKIKAKVMLLCISLMGFSSPL